MSYLLPEHLKPIAEFSLYGISVKDMDREDLLKVIKFLADEMNGYKESEQKARTQLHNLYLGVKS